MEAIEESIQGPVLTEDEDPGRPHLAGCFPQVDLKDPTLVANLVQIEDGKIFLHAGQVTLGAFIPGPGEVRRGSIEY